MGSRFYLLHDYKLAAINHFHPFPNVGMHIQIVHHRKKSGAKGSSSAIKNFPRVMPIREKNCWVIKVRSIHHQIPGVFETNGFFLVDQKSTTRYPRSQNSTAVSLAQDRSWDGSRFDLMFDELRSSWGFS